jgi:hypothetical protein
LSRGTPVHLPFPVCSSEANIRSYPAWQLRYRGSHMIFSRLQNKGHGSTARCPQDSFENSKITLSSIYKCPSLSSVLPRLTWSLFPSTMRFNFLKFLLAFVATAQSAAVPSSHVLHEKRDPASSKQWVRREKPASTEILPMRIGLKQRNLDRGHDFLMDKYISLHDFQSTGIL